MWNFPRRTIKPNVTVKIYFTVGVVAISTDVAVFIFPFPSTALVFYWGLIWPMSQVRMPVKHVTCKHVEDWLYHESYHAMPEINNILLPISNKHNWYSTNNHYNDNNYFRFIQGQIQTKFFKTAWIVIINYHVYWRHIDELHFKNSMLILLFGMYQNCWLLASVS